jgi:pyruvate/2-oxoglutarate dehydrogenase complex dihydrolipoamide dehydrogenase (E3) component
LTKLTGGNWIPVNEFMQTPVHSIFAVGDVNGISLLDSVAAAQANVAVENIVERPVRFDNGGSRYSSHRASNRQHWLDKRRCEKRWAPGRGALLERFNFYR